jgi:MEMO1 family protein
MILPRLRTNLDMMLSPVRDRPGLLIRDFFRYSDATLIVPPLLIPGLLLFDGTRTDLDLQIELTRSLGTPEIADTVGNLIRALSLARFLEDRTYANLKRERRLAFAESLVRQAAHAGSAYPEEIGPLRDLMQQYLGGAASTQKGIMGIAAPHVSPQGGWQGYRAAYKELTPDLRDRIFIVLGTSQHGQPDRFGLT